MNSTVTIHEDIAKVGIKDGFLIWDSASLQTNADESHRHFHLEGQWEDSLTCPEVFQAYHKTTTQVEWCEKDIAKESWEL